MKRCQPMRLDSLVTVLQSTQEGDCHVLLSGDCLFYSFTVSWRSLVWIADDASCRKQEHLTTNDRETHCAAPSLRTDHAPCSVGNGRCPLPVRGWSAHASQSPAIAQVWEDLKFRSQVIWIQWNLNKKCPVQAPGSLDLAAIKLNLLSTKILKHMPTNQAVRRLSSILDDVVREIPQPAGLPLQLLDLLPLGIEESESSQMFGNPYIPDDKRGEWSRPWTAYPR